MRGDLLCLNPYEAPDPVQVCDRWTDNPDAIAIWTKQTYPQFFDMNIEPRRAYISPDGMQLKVPDEDWQPTDGWVAIAETVGILWHDDQSYNEMHFESEEIAKCDYVFDPVDDLMIVEEFLDQIADYYLTEVSVYNPN